MHESIKEITELLQKSDKIVFFGGAGVSTESGIPDFRSADGIFNQDTGDHYLPEQIISESFFLRHPQLFFKFYFDKLVYPEAKPNEAHLFLAELEKKNKEVTIVTQNIDGLHQKAGSTKVLELHGSVDRNYCTSCGATYNYSGLVLDEQGIPRCSKCQSIVRGNVVLYQESLPQYELQESIRAIRQADLLIVGGTSLSVYPAASLLDYYTARRLIVINKTPLTVRHPDAITVIDNIADVFSAVKSYWAQSETNEDL